ncbi:hypothetical protein HC891_07190 [Candidatus Gracilibacteria bacterium]|nr:hypothetical protein [Candidatus Gracilibacteria bacterium]
MVFEEMSSAFSRKCKPGERPSSPGFNTLIALPVRHHELLRFFVGFVRIAIAAHRRCYSVERIA